MGRESFIVVLPARYGSTRFPGKPLAEIAGRPLVEWVYRRALEIRGADDVIVATDDRRIVEAVESFGGNVVMTDKSHRTGTDRVAEVARSGEHAIVVNLQGDEPIFDPVTVEYLVELLSSDPSTDIATACHPVASDEEYQDPNIVKVVTDREGRALYFSRSPAPWCRVGSAPAVTWGSTRTGENPCSGSLHWSPRLSNAPSVWSSCARWKTG
jgi:3-deoxy-manno-octulosonate cytidylyltransferase (CMP-KDO synthetase)